MSIVNKLLYCVPSEILNSFKLCNGNSCFLIPENSLNIIFLLFTSKHIYVLNVQKNIEYININNKRITIANIFSIPISKQITRINVNTIDEINPSIFSN